jgi:hypothetical protein
MADDFHRIYFVQLVEIANASLDQFDKNKGLDDSVAGCSNGKAPMVCFVQNSERITKVIFNGSFGSDSYLVFSGRILITDLPAFAGFLGFCLIGIGLLLFGVLRTRVFRGLGVLWFGWRLLGFLVSWFDLI